MNEYVLNVLKWTDADGEVWYTGPFDNMDDLNDWINDREEEGEHIGDYEVIELQQP